MAYDSFTEFEDPYRRRVADEFPTGGIAGPADGGYGPGSGFVTPRDGSGSQVKAGTYDRDKFVQGWRDSTYAPTEQGFRDYLNQSQYGAGVRYDGGDKFTDLNGRTFDVIGNYGTAGAQKRTGYTTDPRFAHVTGSSKGKNVSAPKGAPQTSTNTLAGGFLAEMRKLLMDRMNQVKGAPSITDPELAAQSNAYGRASQRGVADQRAMLAERAAANGTLIGGQSSGGFDTALQGVMENAAEDRAAYDAQLVGDEVQYRRAALNQLLSMAMQSGDAESARALQMQLAQLDAQLRREGMAQQNSQFNAGLGQRRYEYDDTMGYNQSRDSESDYRWRVLMGLGG